MTETKQNVPTSDQKNLVIVSATGMVGGYALRYAVEGPDATYNVYQVSGAGSSALNRYTSASRP